MSGEISQVSVMQYLGSLESLKEKPAMVAQRLEKCCTYSGLRCEGLVSFGNIQINVRWIVKNTRGNRSSGSVQVVKSLSETIGAGND